MPPGLLVAGFSSDTFAPTFRAGAESLLGRSADGRTWKSPVNFLSRSLNVIVFVDKSKFSLLGIFKETKSHIVDSTCKERKWQPYELTCDRIEPSKRWFKTSILMMKTEVEGFLWTKKRQSRRSATATVRLCQPSSNSAPTDVV